MKLGVIIFFFNPIGEYRSEAECHPNDSRRKMHPLYTTILLLLVLLLLLSETNRSSLSTQLAVLEPL